MELAEVLRRRRMVRRYVGEPVDPGALERVIAAFRRAPTAGASQGQHLVVVTAAAQRGALAEACGEPEAVARGLPPWLSSAPVHLVACARRRDYEQRYAEADKARSRGPDGWDVPFWWVDAGAAIGFLLLAAVDEGLGAGLLDIADPPAVRDILAIPGDVTPVALLTLGHPAPDERPVRPRPRRRDVEVIHRDRWSLG